jgi:1-acyl-sn-glycerol-3-phosphate acyltransferase
VPDERDLWWKVARAIVGGGFEAAFRVSYSGLEHVPTHGGALLAYNHVSVLDPIPVALGAYRRGRITRFLGVAEVFAIPALGWGLRRLRQVPLRRGEGDRRALDAAIAALRDGGVVAMSPEGTVGAGAELQPGHTGAARICLAAGSPVVPVAVWGTQRRWPRQGPHLHRPLRPGVAVAFGPLVAVEGDPSSPEDVRSVTDRVMAALGEQADTARRLAP